jgi:hypothetical protein
MDRSMNTPTTTAEYRAMTGRALPHPQKQERAGPTPLKRTPMNRAPKPVKQRVIAGVEWPAKFMPESEFQTMVERDAHTLGWMHSHSHLPYFDTAGWPDLALVHPIKHRFMVRELKVTSEQGRVGKPTPKQSEWIAALIAAGVDCAVWTWPHDRDKYLEELSA